MANKPYLIGITGGSGSGKTTFLNKLAHGYGSDQVAVISMDNYYFPRTNQVYDENGVQNFDLFDSIDTRSFYQDILALLNGEVLERNEYTFNNKLAENKTIQFKAAPVMLLEGLFVMHMPELKALLDLKIYVEAKDGIKIIRRIKRDQFERNYPVEDVLYRYEAHVLPSYEKYILPYKNEVDIIVNNNTNTDAVINILRHHFDRILNTNEV